MKKLKRIVIFRFYVARIKLGYRWMQACFMSAMAAGCSHLDYFYFSGLRGFFADYGKGSPRILFYGLVIDQHRFHGFISLQLVEKICRISVRIC